MHEKLKEELLAVPFWHSVVLQKDNWCSICDTQLPKGRLAFRPPPQHRMRSVRVHRACIAKLCTCTPGHRKDDCAALRVVTELFPCCGGSDEHPPNHTQDCSDRVMGLDSRSRS